MERQIKITLDTVTVDDTANSHQMRAYCPTFFGPFGHSKRETFTPYRGQMIVRHTVTFTHGKERKTVVYLYLPNGFSDTQGHADFYCLTPPAHCDSVAQAKRIIDKVLEAGDISILRS